MTKKIHKRVMIAVAFLLSLVVLLTAFPIRYQESMKANAAGSGSFHIYFRPGKDTSKGWANDYVHSQGYKIYVYVYGSSGLAEMDETEDGLYHYAVASKPSGIIFVLNTAPAWVGNDTNVYHTDNWRRTNAITSLGNNNTIYYINGNDNTSKRKTTGTDGTYTVYQPISGSTTKRVYFDATLSKLSYRKDTGNYSVLNTVANSMPDPDGKLYYYVTDASGNNNYAGEMIREGTSDLYYVDINPAVQQRIRFTAWCQPNSENKAGSGCGTDMHSIPTDLENPTFYADTGDASVYESGNRGGYWAEKGTLRNAESYKNGNIVPLTSGTMTQTDDILYLNSTFYDYYTDYELNGNNRKDYPVANLTGGLASYRHWVPFRQFAQATSDYYSLPINSVDAKNTIYTGHYQPTVDDWGYPFSGIASTLGLRGWDANAQSFQVNNNSCKTMDSNTTAAQAIYYRYATQNILNPTLPSDGNGGYGAPYLYNSSVVLPQFNEEFLTGTNSKNTVLGEVYHNVAFPFTKVDRDDNGVYYWSFDSAATTLKMKTNQDTGSKYNFFLDTVSQATITDSQGKQTEASRAAAEKIENDRVETQKDRDSSSWSKNLISAGTTKNADQGDYPSNKYGFFPLNDTSVSGSSSTPAGQKYNYGFGTKIEFEFGLTSDGNVKDRDGNKVPITFNFSGDDDIWVYIDGKLVLDMGGDHGRTSGCINFSRANSYDYYYSYKVDGTDNIQICHSNVGGQKTMVSEVKHSANFGTTYSNLDKVDNPTTNSLMSALGLTTTDQINEFYSTEHTLTFYYMERGMWESNMRMQFNFPDHDILQIDKEVDTTTNHVAQDFVDFFSDAPYYFKIQNLVTHYGPQQGTEGEIQSVTFAKDFTGTLAPETDSNVFERAADPLNGSNWTAKYLAHYVNENRSYTDKRCGTFTSDSGSTVNVEGKTYLTFRAYSDSGISSKLIYVKLTDSSGNSIDGRLTDQPFTAGSWNTLKFDMPAITGGFTPSALASVSVEYDSTGNNTYEQPTIYFDDFVFKSNAVTADVGFVINQSDIKDYGSAYGDDGTPGTDPALKPASNAHYSYASDPTKTYAMESDGTLAIKKGETIRFSDQFRRGSYLSLTEQLTPAQQQLYTVQWTISEKDEPVLSYQDGTKVTGASSTALEGVGLSITDNRVEQKDEHSGGSINDYVAAARPTGESIVFRSYENPDAAVSIDLKATFTNIVNTNSLKVTKNKAGDDDLTGSYTFYVVFSDVGGIGLTNSQGESTVVKGPYSLGQTEYIEFSGIPVNTTYTIHEVIPTDGSSLDSVLVNNTAKDFTTNTLRIGNTTLNTKSVTGVIPVAGVDTSTAPDVVFRNKLKETISLSVTKKWSNVRSATVPDTVYLQLQCSATPNDASSWMVVSGYNKFALSLTASDSHTGTVGTDNEITWTKTISGLDKYASGTTPYYYRLKEYASDGTTLLDHNGSFNVNYSVTYNNPVVSTAAENNRKLTATNTYSAIVMPETGVIPLVDFRVIGVSAVGLAVIALLIYKRKLQLAAVTNDEKRGHHDK